jgi:hypothetical protein
MPGSLTTIKLALRSGPLARSILGDANPGQVLDVLRYWCYRALESELESCFACELSVGAVFGVALQDGSRVAIKAHQRAVTGAALEEFQAAQRRLTAAGFPCPRPLAGPSSFLGTLAVAEEWLEGAPGDFARAEHVVASADALVQHVNVLRNFETRRLQRTIAGEPWPPAPHNVLFDFTRDAEGAAWVDDIANRARSSFELGDFVVGHADWSAKHVRFNGDDVCATYDWDSLRRERWPVLAGFAAACHHVLLDPDDPWRAEPERVRAYLDALGVVREERRAAQAAAVYLFAYTARCEHGYAGEPTLTRMRETLEAAAADLLGRA